MNASAGMKARARRLLGVLAIGAIALGTAAAGPAASAAAGPTAAALVSDDDRVSYRLSCRSGNYIGEVELSARVEGGAWIATIERYRIQRLNGQRGGDKANIGFSIENINSSGGGTESPWRVSPDAMRQDGIWHPLNLTTSLDVSRSFGTGVSRVTFTFDRPAAADPACSAIRRSPGAGQSLYGLERTPSVDYTEALGKCTAGTPGITCRITKLTTKTNQISIAAGFDLEAIKFQVSYTWVDTRTLSIDCTSPPLEPGQSFYAYASGHTSTFQARKALLDVPLGDFYPGTAFEADGGIYCTTEAPPSH